MKNADKKILFERMSKVTGMPLKEDFSREGYAISSLYEGLEIFLFQTTDEFQHQYFNDEEIRFLGNIFEKLQTH